MRLPLVPKLRFSSIYDIEPAWLRERGIRLLLADLDNTLVPYSVSGPDEKLLQWERSLKEAGVTLFILSNSRRQGRVETFVRELEVPFLGHAGKPKGGGFRRAMQRMNACPEETAIVGDQIFTDILGGNMAGVLTLLVDPIRFESPFRALRYGFETPFRCAARRGEDA